MPHLHIPHLIRSIIDLERLRVSLCVAVDESLVGDWQIELVLILINLQHRRPLGAAEKYKQNWNLELLLKVIKDRMENLEKSGSILFII